MGGGEAERLRQAHEFVRKQVQRVVMAAHADEDTVQLGFGDGQLGGNHGVLGQSFHLFGNADVALCAGDGGDV